MKQNELHIQTSSLPQAGLSLKGELPLEWMEAVALPAYTAVSPVEYELDVDLVGEQFLVRGRAKTTLSFECSRSLKRDQLHLDIEISELFMHGHALQLNLVQGEELDEEDLQDELWIIENGILDLETLIRENLVLAQPAYPLSQEEQKRPSQETVWTSHPESPDPRWDKLKTINLN